METDRGAVLTIRAALAGAIDFSRARLRDVNWWRYTHVIINQISEMNSLEAIRMAFTWQCALVANGALEAGDFKDIQDRAKGIFNDMMNILRPWAQRDTKEAMLDEVNSLIDVYKKVIGDIHDPAVMAQIRHNIAVSEERAQLAQQPVESVENTINRRIQERERRHAAKLAALHNRKR